MRQAKINNKNSCLSLLFYVLSANVFMRVFKSKVVVNYKILCVFGVLGSVLQGCTSLGNIAQAPFTNIASPQELIVERKINDTDKNSKEYVYHTVGVKNEKDIEVLYPRSMFSQYCQAHGGRFTQTQKSSFSLVKDPWAKKLLRTYNSLKQGTGAFRCQLNNGEQWSVSIEALSERKLPNSNDTRVVNLQSKVLTEPAPRSMAPITPSKKAVTKAPAIKAEVKKEEESKKEVEPKKENKVEVPPKAVKAVETPQQQQAKLYVAARRDINSGRNQVAACNSAQRAYNYGRLPGSDASNVYTESGILVARCLTGIPSYSSRFSNPKGQAKYVLQNLAKNHNHTGAKNMLKQMK